MWAVWGGSLLLWCTLHLSYVKSGNLVLLPVKSHLDKNIWYPKSLQMLTGAMKLKTLILWRESYDQPRQHIKNQRHYFATKFHLVKAMIFPVVMYGCESWTIKKAECLRIDAFELWSWRRLLRVPWTARRSNQSILNQINPECSLEGLMLKYKFQYSGHLMGRADSLEKRKDWSQKEKGAAENEMIR